MNDTNHEQLVRDIGNKMVDDITRAINNATDLIDPLDVVGQVQLRRRAIINATAALVALYAVAMSRRDAVQRVREYTFALLDPDRIEAAAKREGEA